MGRARGDGNNRTTGEEESIYNIHLLLLSTTVSKCLLL